MMASTAETGVDTPTLNRWLLLRLRQRQRGRAVRAPTRPDHGRGETGDGDLCAVGGATATCAGLLPGQG